MKSPTESARFRIPVEPLADPAAMVTGPNVRFTVLTSRLIRMEYSPDGRFEDRASQVFWFRQQPVPRFSVKRERDEVEIVTDHLRVKCRPGADGFHRKSLSIELIDLGTTWRYGDRDARNLMGTARTLDGAEGEVRLERGLISRSGWSVVDDSRSLVFDASGWLTPHTPSTDLYFLGYGHDYRRCLKDFCAVAGRVPMIPRFMLGNWWSRYWEYTQDDLTQLVLDFERNQVPLSVCIIDMDWHITRTGNTSSGWTGYTWNRDLFPDPEAFIGWLHARGLKTALNLHPAEGVHPHEAMYESMAKALQIDPNGQEPILFDIAAPRFAEAYFDVLHHPLEEQGVDFWWIDWQQSRDTRLPGLDPLWWLNHLHFYDLARDGWKRPVIFSRWGGLGNHRYPIGFSGDTHVTWGALAFQTYFTATAANVGYGWWSHDIGGHQRGMEDAELYTRWVQFGVFSPILRLHSTKNLYHERRPWGWDEETLRITRRVMQLRHALIPYLYTMAWRDHVDSVPLIEPMYHAYPESDDAYGCPAQYAFGSELIAAPFTSPRDPATQLSKQPVWLPPGDWFDFFTSEHFHGGWHTMYGGLDDIPVFARGGAIVPLGPTVGWGGVDLPSELEIHVFPGADNRFELYEDDGESVAYQQGHSARTVFWQVWRERSLEFGIEPTQGDRSVVPAARSYTLIFRGIQQPHNFSVLVGGAARTVVALYDAQTESLRLESITLDARTPLIAALSVDGASMLAGGDRRLKTCSKLLRAFRLDSALKSRIDSDLQELLGDARLLQRYGSQLKDAQVAALTHVLRRGTGG